MKTTLESKTSEAILETPKQVTIGGKVYEVAPPTMATLIEVSKYISSLPEINIENEDKIIHEALANASECEYLGDLAAILILGKKKIKPYEVKSRKYGIIPQKKTVYPQQELSTEILDELSPKNIFTLILSILNDMEVGFFLQTTIFLRDVNLLRKTKF